MNADSGENQLPEAASQEAATDAVGLVTSIVVDGELWLVDLADIMEQRTPGRNCDRFDRNLPLLAAA